MWAHVQNRRSYLSFVAEFDDLKDDDVRWTPYSHDKVLQRAPFGLSSLCFRDRDYWLTRKPLVFDIFVEEHAVHRVLRQFGLYQASPLPVVHTVPANVHRYPSFSVTTVLTNRMSICLVLYTLVVYRHTRQGMTRGHLWAPRMVPWVQQCEG
jgi:hypothetical protein